MDGLMVFSTIKIVAAGNVNSTSGNSHITNSYYFDAQIVKIGRNSQNIQK